MQKGLGATPKPSIFNAHRHPQTSSHAPHASQAHTLHPGRNRQRPPALHSPQADRTHHLLIQCDASPTCSKEPRAPARPQEQPSAVPAPFPTTPPLLPGMPEIQVNTTNVLGILLQPRSSLSSAAISTDPQFLQLDPATRQTQGPSTARRSRAPRASPLPAPPPPAKHPRAPRCHHEQVKTKMQTGKAIREIAPR